MINGRTRLHVVANGTMAGQRYIDEVLLPHVRLFRGAVGDKFVFMDDNATCHRTLAVQDCLDSEDIQRLVWPARSPDLNPIENVWDVLGRQVAGRNYPPPNKNTLIRALTEEWDKLPQQLLDNIVQNSTIALTWIKTEPHKLKTFVSNRVAEIQALSKNYHWKHVSSKNNPADLISRGCNVDELLKNEMWFSGPDLQTDEYEDNQLFPDPSYRDELKCAVTLSMTECSSNFYELFNVTNNFIKLIRIFSFIFRFINNIKAKESCNKEKYLTADEVKRSTEFLAKIAQLSEFKAEIDA
ncbi:uncharacterized protein TNCV_2559461 [Trichonephila clavipes]|nr:uncharacterized protein TNCV_2559461 [Trichonephila clavipes]